MEKIKKAFKWLLNHLKIFLLIIGVILTTILILWWGRKNKQIRKLEQQLAISKAKLHVERLEVKYNNDIAELKKLKDKDAKIKKEIEEIEKSLSKKLKPDMTAEEIAEKFKELGL